MYPSSERWKGTWRGSPLRLAVHTKNIGGMMWTTNPGVTVGYYTMDSDVYVCDDGFHLNTSEKTVNNFQLEGPYPTRVQVRVYDENGQLMPTMPCIVETKGGCGGDCPPIYDPLPINCNTNEWVVPKTDDYHTSNYMTSISGQPTLDIAVRVSVDKDYTQTLNSVHMGFDTYIDFTVGPNQPPDQTDGGVDWTPVAAAIGALVGLGGLGYWLWKRKKK
jgi:LPXTG-motif cell wall-anchored protein